MWSSRLLRSIFVEVRKSALLNSLSICFTDFNCLNICYVSFQLYSCKSPRLLGAGLLLKTVLFFLKKKFFLWISNRNGEGEKVTSMMRENH